MKCSSELLVCRIARIEGDGPMYLLKPVEANAALERFVTADTMTLVERAAEHGNKDEQ
jgi:hypothetical protein